ncbi:MAG TPA: hypothetical protein VJ743_23025 [Albitalea sp.]|nr:hypothetical protein [Albitalea sp.]
MGTQRIPVKTAEGQAELSHRQRRLSQRHRTVLLLVDGRRNEQQVRALALQAGAGDTCFDELLDQGLISVPPSFDPAVSTVPIPRPPVEKDDEPLHVDIPLDEPAPSGPSSPDPGPESLLPAAATLQPESVLGDSLQGQSVLEDFDALDEAPSGDPSLEEARGILLQAVRREAPVAGSLTMLRLRRARTRGDLVELIDEVEARIIKPYRSLAAQQVLRRARHLLAPRAESVSQTA